MTENEYYALLGKAHQTADDLVYEANKLQTQIKEFGLIYDGKKSSLGFEHERQREAVENQLKYLQLLVSSIEGNAAHLRRTIDDHWIKSGEN